MRWLIDGYNIMHAGGRLGTTLGRQGFRRARRRFLDELVAVLGPDRASRTTVVFDASAPPGDFGLETTHRGLSLIFALEDEDADTRIERILARDSNPRTLTVYSSDRRIRQAAARRRADPRTAEEFWDWIDDLRERAKTTTGPHEREAGPQPAAERREPASEEESEFWNATFAGLDDAPETRQALSTDMSLLTDREIAEIQRQVDREA
jgi:predicted RNA-binding protein with PIN domain